MIAGVRTVTLMASGRGHTAAAPHPFHMAMGRRQPSAIKRPARAVRRQAGETGRPARAGAYRARAPGAPACGWLARVGAGIARFEGFATARTQTGGESGGIESEERDAVITFSIGDACSANRRNGIGRAPTPSAS